LHFEIEKLNLCGDQNRSEKNLFVTRFFSEKFAHESKTSKIAILVTSQFYWTKFVFANLENIFFAQDTLCKVKFLKLNSNRLFRINYSKHFPFLFSQKNFGDFTISEILTLS